MLGLVDESAGAGSAISYHIVFTGPLRVTSLAAGEPWSAAA